MKKIVLMMSFASMALLAHGNGDIAGLKESSVGEAYDAAARDAQKNIWHKRLVTTGGAIGAGLLCYTLWYKNILASSEQLLLDDYRELGWFNQFKVSGYARWLKDKQAISKTLLDRVKDGCKNSGVYIVNTAPFWIFTSTIRNVLEKIDSAIQYVYAQRIVAWFVKYKTMLNKSFVDIKVTAAMLDDHSPLFEAASNRSEQLLFGGGATSSTSSSLDEIAELKILAITAQSLSNEDIKQYKDYFVRTINTIVEDLGRTVGFMRYKADQVDEEVHSKAYVIINELEQTFTSHITKIQQALEHDERRAEGVLALIVSLNQAVAKRIVEFDNLTA